MMKLTDGQLAAYTALGLLIMYEEQTLLAYMTEDELVALTEATAKVLNPLVNEDEDLVSPLVRVLRSAMIDAIAQDLTKDLTK
jgi:hypothetical protein